RCPAQLEEGPPHRHLARPPRHLWLTPVSPWGLVLGSWVLGAGCAYPGPLGPGPCVVGPGACTPDTWFPWLWARLSPGPSDLWRAGGSTVAVPAGSALAAPPPHRAKRGAAQRPPRPRCAHQPRSVPAHRLCAACLPAGARAPPLPVSCVVTGVESSAA